MWVAAADGSRARRITQTDEPKQDLAWSPNGKWLAFSVCADTSCRRGIDLVRPDGTALHRLVNDALQPTWSPDSRLLAYAGETQSFGVPAAIDVIPAVGGRQRRIAPVGSHPQWQPRAGRWILYEGPCGNGGDLCVVTRTGHARHVLGDGDAAAWSPRGDRIAVVGNEVGLGIVRLARPRRVRWIGHHVDTLPVWTNDTRSLAYVESTGADDPVRIVFASARTGRSHVVRAEPATTIVSALALTRGGLAYDAEVEQKDLDLFVGGRPLTSDAADDREPAWSRDGAHVAYVRQGPTSPWQSALWVANADGTHARLVASVAGATVSEPSWSPDGTRVVFARRFHETDQTDIAVVDVASLRVSVLPLPEEGRYGAPAWSPDGTWIALVADGSLALVHPDGTDLHSLAGGAATGASWSPGGDALAFVREVAPGSYELATVDLDGRVHVLAADAWPDGGRPAWGPTIAYVRATADGSEVVTVAPDGSGAAVATTAPARNVDPAWRG